MRALQLRLTQLSQAAGEEIVNRASSAHTSLLSSVYTRELFQSEFSDVLSSITDVSSPLSSTDTDILLTYLSRDMPVLAYDGTTIKFLSPDDSRLTPITEADTTVAQLRSLISSLNTQIDALTARADALQSDARAAVASKRTVAAKSALRQKRLAESTLQTRHATLDQLESTAASLEQAADNAAVLRIMRKSADVLKDLNKEAGGAEGAENVMERLRQETENANEIGQIINEGAATGVDEMEVDEELERMEIVESAKNEMLEKGKREKREKEEAEQTARRLQELDTLKPGEVSDQKQSVSGEDRDVEEMAVDVQGSKDTQTGEEPTHDATQQPVAQDA